MLFLAYLHFYHSKLLQPVTPSLFICRIPNNNITVTSPNKDCPILSPIFKLINKTPKLVIAKPQKPIFFHFKSIIEKTTFAIPDIPNNITIGDETSYGKEFVIISLLKSSTKAVNELTTITKTNQAVKQPCRSLETFRSLLRGSMIFVLKFALLIWLFGFALFFLSGY